MKPRRCAAREPGRRCVRPVDLDRHQLCWAHYKRWLRTGSTGSATIRASRRHPTYKP